MKSRTKWIRLLGACLLAGASAAGNAQSGDAVVAPAAASKQAREIAQGDPARWYREDTTAQQRMRTRQKEIGAALAEARNACRQGPAAERAACMQAAQATWKEEMQRLRNGDDASEATPAPVREVK